MKKKLLRRVRVLVVDDSLTIRAMLRQVIEEDPEILIAGLAASAAEADRVLQDELVDVITLDVEMPGYSGIDYLRYLRKHRQTPVVMLSNYTGRGTNLRALALAEGAASCFDKVDAMVDRAQLLQLIKDAAHREVRLDRDDLDAVAAIRAAA